MQDEGTIFRKNALKHKSGAEKLDTPIEIIRMPYWLLLCGFGLLVFLGIFWFLFGTITYNVAGNCILLKNTGLNKVTPNATGKITDIYVQAGDKVVAGQIIARIEQNDLRDQIYLLRNYQEEQQIRYDKLSLMYSTLVKNLTSLSGELGSIYKNQKDLFAKGIVTQPTVINTDERLKNVLYSLEKVYLEQLNAENSLAETKRKLILLEDEYERNTKITATVNGVVVDVNVQKDQNVDLTTAIIDVESENKSIEILQAYIYIPAINGKKIQQGMPVNIKVDSVRSEIYGTILAQVTSVSQYPVTRQSLIGKIQNEAIVQRMLQENAVFEVIARLTPDTTTQSGYDWTSKGGPPMKIQSGTFCSANIQIEKRRPIELVIPSYSS